MIAYAITKTVSIDAPVERVFKYLADAANWPKWAIVNVKVVKPAGDAWWHMETPSGKAKLRIRPNAELGILDHDFNAPEASWTVAARVVPNGSGCESSFTRQFFEEQLALVDRELAQLKSLMERGM